MTKGHLKRLNTPAHWPIKRKEQEFVARARPGPHSLRKAITLNILLKDILKYAATTREVKKILAHKEVMVDKKARKDHRFPIGFMDVIEIPRIKEAYVIDLDTRGRLIPKKVDIKEATKKTCRIMGKTLLKEKKTQLNLYDGKNILVEKDEYEVGDSIIFDLEKKRIVEHLKLEKKAPARIIEGKHKGEATKVEEMKERKGVQPQRIICGTGKGKMETLKKYVFVVKG
ncbi:30S ribosomal protein S4e [Candidatus Woesearchaeota archaeon]|nr:30S ribosomal protein S4e [Candidatus Woesearchaeota archaeon]